MTPWLIHIGYRKCGSTWMQRRLFPSIPGIDFLGKRYDQPDFAWLKQVRDALAIKHCFDFSPDEVHALIERHATPPDGRMRVLSCEGFSGELWRRNIDSKRNADRIHQTFPNARILVVTRRQVAHLESLYKQYLRTGGVISFSEFLTADSHHLQFDINSLRYDRLVEYYIQLFGRQHVEVLPFEQFVADPQAFSDAICDFCQVPRITLGKAHQEYVRRGYTPRQCALVRRFNVLRKSTFSPVGLYTMSSAPKKSKWGPSNPYPWTEFLAAFADKILGPGQLLGAEEKTRLTEHFRESNEVLATHFPIIAKYGYASATPSPGAAIPSDR